MENIEAERVLPASVGAVWSIGTDPSTWADRFTIRIAGRL